MQFEAADQYNTDYNKPNYDLSGISLQVSIIFDRNDLLARAGPQRLKPKFILGNYGTARSRALSKLGRAPLEQS
jgi:hypothetical protein